MAPEQLAALRTVEPLHHTFVGVPAVVAEARDDALAGALELVVRRVQHLEALADQLVVLRTELPRSVSDLFEFLVALMLIGLGARAVYLAARQGAAGPAHVHHHGHLVHSHAGVPAHVHIGHWTLARRPLLVGAVHGLAGSGALTALVLTTLPTTAARLAYMSLFGLGSTLGMAALSGLLGWPIARMGSHHAVARTVSMVVGCVSIGLGVVWAYPFISHLLSN